MKINKLRYFLFILSSALFLYCTKVNAEMQYGRCGFMKYVKVIHDGKTNYSSMPVEIWWKSDLETGEATSSLGPSDEPPTKYRLMGFQEIKGNKINWVISKEIADDTPADDKWIISGYGFKQDVRPCEVTSLPSSKYSYNDNSALINFQKFLLLTKGTITVIDAKDIPGGYLPRSASTIIGRGSK